MSIEDITAAEVEAAIRECDSLGHEEFLKLYGFGEAKAYKLISGGREYASKAILGVAHKFSRTTTSAIHGLFWGQGSSGTSSPQIGLSGEGPAPKSRLDAG